MHYDRKSRNVSLFLFFLNWWKKCVAINKKNVYKVHTLSWGKHTGVSNYRIARKKYNTDDTRNAKQITKVICIFSNLFFSVFFSEMCLVRGILAVYVLNRKHSI